MKKKTFLKRLFTLFCTLVFVFPIAACHDDRKAGGSTNYKFDNFKDFSTFHSEYSTKIQSIKSLAFNIDDVSFNVDSKGYLVNFPTVPGPKNGKKINKDNLIDHVANASIMISTCELSYKYNKNLAEKRYYNENVETETSAEDKNGFYIQCNVFSVRTANNNEVEPSTENLSYFLKRKDNVTYRNYYECRLVIDGVEEASSYIMIILNETNDDLAEGLMKSLIKSAVVLE